MMLRPIRGEGERPRHTKRPLIFISVAFLFFANPITIGAFAYSPDEAQPQLQKEALQPYGSSLQRALILQGKTPQSLLQIQPRTNQVQSQSAYSDLLSELKSTLSYLKNLLSTAKNSSPLDSELISQYNQEIQRLAGQLQQLQTNVDATQQAYDQLVQSQTSYEEATQNKEQAQASYDQALQNKENQSALKIQAEQALEEANSFYEEAQAAYQEALDVYNNSQVLDPNQPPPQPHQPGATGGRAPDICRLQM
jgi:tetratricopeptide (TPR) repeat protein